MSIPFKIFEIKPLAKIVVILLFKHGSLPCKAYTQLSHNTKPRPVSIGVTKVKTIQG